jgi:hypothetical protein
MLAHQQTDGELTDRLLAMTHAKARTDVEVASWVASFSVNDGRFGSFRHLCSLADIKARSAAKHPESPEKLGAWMYEEMQTMPHLGMHGPGIRFRQLLILLQQNWTVKDESPPSESSIRRQLDVLVEQGRLEIVTRDRRLGDLYRLKEPDDDSQEPTAPDPPEPTPPSSPT